MSRGRGQVDFARAGLLLIGFIDRRNFTDSMHKLRGHFKSCDELLNFSEDLDSRVQGLVKRLLLPLDDSFDVVLFSADFGEYVAHGVGENRDKFVEEGLVEIESAAIA